MGDSASAHPASASSVPDPAKTDVDPTGEVPFPLPSLSARTGPARRRLAAGPLRPWLPGLGLAALLAIAARLVPPPGPDEELSLRLLRKLLEHPGRTLLAALLIGWALLPGSRTSREP